MLPQTIDVLAKLRPFVVRVDSGLKVLSSDGPGLTAVGLAPGVGVGQPLDALVAGADPPGVVAAACVKALKGDTTSLTVKWRALRFRVTVGPAEGAAEIVGLQATDWASDGDTVESLGGLVNQLDGMVYRCRVDAAWTMVVVTDGCLPITGYTADQLRMNREVAFGDLVHPDDQGWLWDKCSTNLACGRACSNQYRIRHADGTYRWVWDRAHGVYDAADVLLRVEGLITDVTAEKEREHERVQLEAQVRHAQRLDSLGLLAGGVAHDFNNLLQVILGHAELARAKLPVGSSLGHDVDAIEQSALRAAELTGQLLTFGRRQPVSLSVVDFNEIVEGQAKLLRRLLPESITLAFIPGRRMPMVEVDVTQLQQVITNLCINARDAMRGGGALTLESETVLVNGEHRAAHPWAKPGRYVLLSVTDTGTGIPAELQSLIFEPFFTTKPPGEGTGLGLAMVYGIVRAHDGMVHVYSEPGLGTTFKVYVPASERLATRVGTKLEPAPPGRRERVLVVEDDAAVRNLVVRILSGAGYQTVEAINGLAALRLVQDGERVDLVLTDAVMPGLGGPEVLVRLRALRPGLKAILSTGYGRERLPSADPVVQVLLKPYVPDELLRMVRQVLDAS